MNEQDRPYVGWDVPGWDWEDGDYSWLHSESGIHDGDTSIFFIHGGRIRHQANIPHGSYTPEQFAELVAERAEGLDGARLVWCEDTGGGNAGLWVEGTRAPNEDDLARLQQARRRQEHNDRISAWQMRHRHPNWFTDKAPYFDRSIGEYGQWVIPEDDDVSGSER